jgi:hypothetical protein
MTDDPGSKTGKQEHPAVAGAGPTAADPSAAEPAEVARGALYLLPSVAGRTEADPAAVSDHRTDAADRPTAGGTFQADLEPEPIDSARPDDWAWVEEWRTGGEPTPWVTGLPLAAFAALVVAVAIWVLSAGLSDRPVVAVLVNLLVAGGLAPAVWLSRGLPVLRWIAAGCAAGVVIGWISAILMLPVPMA